MTGRWCRWHVLATLGQSLQMYLDCVPAIQVDWLKRQSNCLNSTTHTGNVPMADFGHPQLLHQNRSKMS